MPVYTMANTKIYIGTTAVADDVTSYGADTFVEIGNVESISGLDDTQNFTQFTGLSDGRAQDLKTTRAGQPVTVTCAFDPDDAGQDAVRAAALVTTQDKYNFKVVYNDAGSSNATTVYWSGPVGNNSFPGGGVEDVSTVEYTLRNNTGFVVDFRA